jgi:hypothetical protein
MQRILVLLCAGALACGASSLRQAPPFDAARAYGHIRELVGIGPRPAGSEAAERTRTYVKSHLQTLGIAVDEQAFVADTPLGPVRMVNLRATLSGQSGPDGRRLVIAGHYDTKLFREFAFVGANDGGSSTAVLLELASVLKGRRAALPIDLVFFDGEEAVVDWNQGEDNTYGSRHYVNVARADGTLKDIAALVLVDMIGDRDLRIKRESNSTPWLTDIIWNAARRLKRPEFVEDAIPIEDDHLPFLRAGVPAVDIIDLDYPAWHTADDTLDKVSPDSLQAVGDVLIAALPELMDRLSR